MRWHCPTGRLLALALVTLASSLLAPLQGQGQGQGQEQELGLGLGDPENHGRPRKLRGWPIYYRETYRDGCFETHALFSLYHRSQRDTGKSLFLAPVYWSNQETAPPREWSLLVPAYYRQNTAERWSFWSLPVSMGARKDQAESWLWAPGILPLYAGHEGPAETQRRAGLPFLFDLVGYSQDSSGSDLSALSLLPWGRPGTALLSALRMQRDPDGALASTHLFPLYAYDPDDHLILPFLLSGRSWDGASTRDTAWPLLGYWERTADEYRWTALLGLEAGGHTPRRSWLRVEPLFDFKRSATHGRFTVAHLYGRSWDLESGVSAHHVLPPLGRFEHHPTGYRHYLFPLFYAARQDTASCLAIAPLYFQERASASSITLLFPLYYARHAEREDGHEVARVGFPLFWQLREPGSEHLHILPLYSRHVTPARRLDMVLGPLYVRRSEVQDHTRSHSVLWPLCSFESSDRGGHAHVFPIYWSTRDGADRLDVVAPLYLRSAGKDYSHHWLVPVYGRHRWTLDEEGTTLERRFYGGGLLVHGQTRAGDGSLMRERYDLVGPVAGMSRDRTTDTTHSRLLPLWWQTRSPDQRLTLAVGNLWVDRARAGSRDRGVLWPLTWQHTEDGRSWTQVLGLFGQARRAEQHSHLRLSPLLYVARTEQPRDSSIARWLHLASHESGPWGSRSLVFPYLYHRETVDPALYPEAGKRWDALLGLAGGHRGGEHSHLRVLPLYWHSRKGPADAPEEETRVFVPFFHQSLREAGARRSLSILFPCYYQEVREDGGVARSLPWPFVTVEHAPGIQRGNFFFLAGYHRMPGVENAWRLLPLAEHRSLASREVNGLWSRDGYLGLSLARHARGPQSRTLAIHPFLFGSHRDDTRARSDWEALLFVAGHHRDGDRTRFHALGLLNGAARPGRAWWSLFPLAFRAHQEDEPLARFTLPEALHLYARVASPDEQRWSVLGILANGKRVPARDESSLRVLHRLAVFRREGSYTERVLEPLFTYEDDPDSGAFYHAILKFLYVAQRDGHDDPIRRRLLFIPLG